VLTPKEETAPEGAAYRSQIIEEGSQSRRAQDALRAVLLSLDIGIVFYREKLGELDRPSQQAVVEEVRRKYNINVAAEWDSTWGNWIPVYEGRRYRLTDLGSADVEGLYALFTGTFQNAYPVFLGRIEANRAGRPWPRWVQLGTEPRLIGRPPPLVDEVREFDPENVWGGERRSAPRRSQDGPTGGRRVQRAPRWPKAATMDRKPRVRGRGAHTCVAH
jgi:hypothetical protein